MSQQSSVVVLHEYQLIDWSKPAPIIPSVLIPTQSVMLTEYEAWSLNQGFGLNGVTKRYIKND